MKVLLRNRKKKVHFHYNISEKQFRRFVRMAKKGQVVNWTDKLFSLLETRLDNVVFRMGMSNTRDGARQLVSHKHITVNGRIVNIPSYTLRPGDKVAVREKSKSLQFLGNFCNRTIHWGLENSIRNVKKKETVNIIF